MHRVWLITGCSTGFGRHVAEIALKNGDKVVATARQPETLADLKAEYSSEQLLTFKLDVRNHQDIRDAFAAAKSTFGRIDVVFNNAGYGAVSEVEGTPEDLARDIFETNFWGAAHVTQEAVRFFREVNKPAGGRLLQQTSLVGIGALPLVGFYSASKAAFESINEALAIELDPRWNIKLTMIEPGAFPTAAVKHSGNLVETPIHPAYNDPSMMAYNIRQLYKATQYKGDVKKAAQAMYKVSMLPDPPLRLPLGKDGIEHIRRKLESVKADVDKNEAWSDDLMKSS